jgi:hypothetical protein
MEYQGFLAGLLGAIKERKLVAWNFNISIDVIEIRVVLGK